MTEQNALHANHTVKWIKEKFKSEHLLTSKEEFALFNLVKKGDVGAKRILLKSNMKFVIQVAANYHSESLSAEDLINEGAIGLWRAIDYFDHTRGVRFITYAVWWIKAQITRAISEKGSMVRLPLNQQTLLHKEKAARRDCSSGLSQEMQIIDAIGGKALSLNQVIDCESGIRLEDVIPCNNNEDITRETEKGLLQKFTNKILAKLPQREKQIISDLHGINREIPRSIREESLLLGLSRERIRQLRNQATHRIRNLNYDGHLNAVLQEI